MSGSKPRLKTSIPTIEAIGMEISIANKQVNGGTSIKYGRCCKEIKPKEEFNANDMMPITNVSKKVSARIALIRE